MGIEVREPERVTILILNYNMESKTTWENVLRESVLFRQDGSLQFSGEDGLPIIYKLAYGETIVVVNPDQLEEENTDGVLH